MMTIVRYTCPSCRGGIVVDTGIVYARDRNVLHVRVALFARCAGCSLVSEVDPDTGSLVDLGHVTLASLSEFYEDAHPLLVQDPSLLYGRRDS